MTKLYANNCLAVKNYLRSLPNRLEKKWLMRLKKHALNVVCLLLMSTTLLPAQTINFGASALAGDNLSNPTSLQFGPDERLYVSQQNGFVYAYTIQRSGANNYAVTKTETIDLVKLYIPDHNDDGTPNEINSRQVTGIYVTGTRNNPVLYVSSSDIRVGAGGGGIDLNLDTNSGVISRLTWIGNGVDDPTGYWDKVDIVRGLPRSEENHSVNGMQMDKANNILYVAVGGMTNSGAPSNNFAFVSEYALSACILKIDLDAIEAMPIKQNTNLYSNYTYKWIYDIPTLDDPTRNNVNGINDPKLPGYNGIDLNDPFGGNDGLNQGKIVPGGPVQIHAAGFRNLYDFVILGNGRMYGVDNGANGGWGGHPDGEADYPREIAVGAQATVTNRYLVGEPGSTTGSIGPGGDDRVNNLNGLHYIRPLVSGEFNYAKADDIYYGGHPNPTRGNPGNTFNPATDNYPFASGGAGIFTKGPHTQNPNDNTDGYWRNTILNPNDPNFKKQSLPVDWPPLPTNAAFPAEGDFRNSGQDDNSIANYGPSTNGICEYTASNFNNSIKGNLLMAGFTGSIYIAKLSANGKVVTNCPTPPFNGNSTLAKCDDQTFASNFGSTPLDVIAQGDNDIFPGTVWAVTYGANNITIFEPADYNGGNPGTCAGINSDSVDEDGDGYTNADEIANGTAPCSAASKPDDFDNALEFGAGNAFKRSNLLDADDDNDGIPDINDPFQWDATNGKSAIGNLPFALELFNSTGYGYGSIGFTGWMIDNQTDYLNLLDAGDELILGGAAGLYTDPTVSNGTALGAANSQKNAFQFGVNVSTATGPFTIAAQINGPFFNGNLPQPNAAQGIQIGAGDQDNYLRLVVSQGSGDASVPGFEVLYESNGSVVTSQTMDVPNLLQADAIILYLSINPNSGAVQARYAPIENSELGAVVNIGTPITVSGKVLSAIQGNYTINGVPVALALGVIATSDGPSPEFGANWDYFRVQQDESSTKADVAITANNINGSTFSGGFRVENKSSNGEKITKVIFDLSTGIIPELVFDPNGTAGDAVAKGFTPTNNSADPTGVTTHSFSQPYEGGFYQLEINFNSFSPNEVLQFAVDVDPVSIKGGSSPGPNESGSVSGLELAGTTVTVVFDNGQTHAAQLYRTQQNNPGSSRNIVRSQLPATPGIEMLNVPSKTIVNNPTQTIRVTGTPNKPVTLLQLEAGLFVEDLDGPYAGVGYQIDSFEVNSIIKIEEYDATIGADGTAEFEVTLTKTDREAGYNLFAAVTVDPDGGTSNLSNVIIVKYEVDASLSIVVQPINNQTSNEGYIAALVVSASGGDGALQFSATGLPPGLSINASSGQITGTIQSGAAIGGTNNNGIYNVTITIDDSDGDNADIKTVQFTWTVLPPGNNSAMTLNVSLEGRSNHSGAYSIKLYQPGSTTQIGSTYNLSASTTGAITISNLNAGTYDILLKHPQYLSRLIRRTLTNGINNISGGFLKAGDANNDNLVSALDFSILASTFNKILGGNGFDARPDFNNDGRISALDFSLMATNFNTPGAVPGGTPNLTTDSVEKLRGWEPVRLLLQPQEEVIRTGQAFAVQLLVQANEQPFDAVETHLQFDPNLLEVDSIHWADELEIKLRETIDNTAGELHLAAGSLVKSLQGERVVATLICRAKNIGEAVLNFVNSNSLEQEVTWRGTNVLGSTVSTTLNIQTTTNASDLTTNALQLDLYPVPSKGNFTLELNGADAFQSSKVQIFNTLGQVVFQQSYTGNVRELIDLSPQPKGIYRVQVQMNRQVITKNIVIQ